MTIKRNLQDLLAKEKETKSKAKEIHEIVKVKLEKEAETAKIGKATSVKIAKEKITKERIAKEKIAKEKISKEKAEKEKAAKDKIAKERAEKEKAAKKQIEKERAEKEKIANEKLAKEKYEKAEKAREKFLKENAEKEKLAKEKADKVKLAKEKAEKEKLDKEKINEGEPVKVAKPRARLVKSRPTITKEKGSEASDNPNMEGEKDLRMALIVRGSQADDDVDEEAEERDDFHMAKLAKEFVEEEEHIRHDAVPDSDDEREGRNDSDRERPQFRRGHGSMYMGQSFYNAVAFKETVTDYCLSTGYNLRQYRHDRDKIGFKCVGSDKCEFQVYASSLPRDPTWRIRVFKDKHCCIPNGQCDMFKVPVIARLFVDKMREEPDYYMPMKIEQLILEQWKISVTRSQCQIARCRALRWLEVEADKEFARLRDYAAEILECNRGSTVEIDTVQDEEGRDLFNRFYVCFDVLRKTWKQTCRPLIGVDGCFLKAKIRGQLLVAIGRDADNAIYPIAWGVVQVENKENWLWFLRLLKRDLDLRDGDGFIIVSDRQKGLIAAVELELPKVEHRMCVRHIYSNLKKDHASKLQMKPLIWNLAWSYNEVEFQQRLERIYAYDLGVYDSVMKSNPRSWCRAFYKIGNYCEDVENNSTEAFNRTLNKAREKPFVAMLEAVRRLAMVRIAKRSAISHDHQGICTPYVTKFLEMEHAQAAICRVSPSTNAQYEVQLEGNTYRVSLGRLTCTCCKFQICGIPCEHAYAVILNKKLKPEDYVCQWFRTNMWKLNYTEGIVPQRGSAFWPDSMGNDIHIPPAPAQTGRKKITKADKKRKQGVNESPIKKQPKKKKREMHCSICGSPDHNCRTHFKVASSEAASENQNSQVQENQVQESQVQLSQSQASMALEYE